jgi:hypothetical protein
MACGLVFRGRDGPAADCFAVRQGRKQGWLTKRGMDEICKFIRPAKGGQIGLTVQQPGPVRCKAMRQCFAEPAGE